MIRALTALAVTVALFLGFGAAAAEATSKPSKADKSAMVRANLACTGEPDEVGYENCVVGAFVITRHRYIDEGYYTADYSAQTGEYEPCPKCIVLDRASKKV